MNKNSLFILNNLLKKNEIYVNLKKETNKAGIGMYVKKILIPIVFLSMVFLMLVNNLPTEEKIKKNNSEKKPYKQINGTVKKGETLFAIFKKYQLELNELFEIKESSAKIHDLRKLCLGRPYMLSIDKKNRINSFTYFMDDDEFLNITRSESGFKAEKIPLDYETRINQTGGTIEDNLISSIGNGKENTLLALEISDIFSWDIDFSTDIQRGDTFKVVVEALYLDGEFKKYGNILAVEFINDGKQYRAYRFTHNGKTGYYDSEGRSVRKVFLKAPLSFKRISSYFTKKRFHPILKIHRPHHGVDYAAPSGTPVSATADGTVIFAGYRGAYGKLVVLKHKNNYKTYYGHLSRISKGLKKGIGINQGDVIGYVGKTGLATGPHLHYEMRIADKYTNPLNIKQSFKKNITGHLLAEYRKITRAMNRQFASITVSNPVHAGNTNRTTSDRNDG